MKQHNALDKLYEHDKLTPGARLDKLIEEFSIDRKMCEQCLLGLEAIDISIATHVRGVSDSSRNFYVFRDESLKCILEKVLNVEVSREMLIKSLILLNETDLIFRFTAARKFNVSDPSDKQLRINSWGKLYIAENNLEEKHRDVFARLLEEMAVHIENKRAEYEEITSILSRPIKPASAKEIATLNSRLTVTLLS